MEIFERLESNVRTYIRSFPVTFASARGSRLTDSQGRSYIDFFCGAGALSYGHNEPSMKQALLEYLQSDGVIHALDMATEAKARFLESFERIILKPRGLDYRMQFTGPTGANAIEAALKLARKVTGRRGVVAFTRGYHGLSAGALAATANAHYRHEAYLQRGDVSFLPFDGYLGMQANTMDYFAGLLRDRSSGLGLPAAVILETVQAEGGVQVARATWLQQLAGLCKEHGMLLIVDDIQAGCGRTGDFFSFEASGIRPDLVALSKAISGYGFPMSLLLIRPDLDQWEPGEHTGTFRGNNVAFVTGAQALLRFWQDDQLRRQIERSHDIVMGRLQGLTAEAGGPTRLAVRGRGLLIGVETPSPAHNLRIARACFGRGLVIETCGGEREVVKLLPCLNIPEDVLQQAMDILCDSVLEVLAA
jgi:diaminobutyrate-2-oxoglutarate transaminase